MTTKAPPKKADPLVKVAEAEAAMTEAQEAAEAAGLKLAEATERVKALQQERAQLVHDDPTLVDHRSEPVEACNAVGKIDAELSEIDLEDAELRYGHNKELARAAQERWHGLVREHGREIDEARQPDGEALVAEWQATAAALAEVSERLIGFGQRSMTLAATRGLDTRLVPIEAISDRVRTIRELVAHPPPVPGIENPPPAPKSDEEE